MKTPTLVMIFLAIGALAAKAATVHLKGGGTLEGKVVSSNDRQVVLDTSQGRVSIDASRVQSIDDNAPPPPAVPPAPMPPPRRVLVRRHEELFEPRLNTLSLDFGLAIPATSIDFGAINGGRANDGDIGARIGFQYLREFRPRNSLGLEFAYLDRSATDSPDLVPDAFAHVSGDSVILMANYKYTLAEEGSVRPYLLLGAGGHYTSTTVDAAPNPGFVWSDTLTAEHRRIVDGSAWGPAMSVRGGLDFLYAQPNVFSLEVGWTGLANSTLRPTAQGQALGLSGSSGMLNVISLSGRWGWSF
ncbi:MAG TPA: hypothetical protein VN915_12610 [Elusimicrobiota bacterium]|nr:hypothetical protein [Elusimicrobiota bacterium]